MRAVQNMRRENVNAGEGFRGLVTSFKQGLLDLFIIALLVGGISIVAAAYSPTIASYLILATILIIAWRFHRRRATHPRIRPRQPGLEGDHALLQIAGKTAKLGGWVVHLPDRTLHWSDETWAIHERTRDEPISFEEAIGYFAPEWQDKVVRLFDSCVATGLPYDTEVEIITATGQRKWVRAIGVAIRDDMDRISRIQGAFQDIDERKRLENAAKDIERRFAESMEHISDAFFQLDTDWRFTYLNHQAERLLERPRSALLGASIWQEFPEASSGIIRQHYERAVGEGKTADFEVFYESLDTWFSVTAYPGPTGLTVYFRDVTKRRAADQHLHLLEMAISRIEDFVIITTAGSEPKTGQTIVYVNDAFVRITGYSPEEAVGRSPGFLQGQRSDVATIEKINRAVAQSRPIHAEIVNYAKDGREYWVDMLIAPIVGPDGCATHFVATGRDITDRKRAAEKLVESEERFAIVAMMTTDAVWDWDVKTGRVQWNRNIASVFGHDDEPAEDGFRAWEENIHPDDRPRVVSSVLAAIGGQAETWQEEFRFRRGAGTYANVLDQGHIIRNAAGEATRMVGGLRDVTETRLKEAKRLQAQRLEAIGQLTGGVAHDFNNLLTVLIGTAETLADEVSDPRLSAVAQLNHKASRQGAALTRQLLTFAGRQPLEPSAVNINSPIVAIEGLLSSALGETIMLHLKLNQAAGHVRADAAQLEASIVNLCINARDAMPDGGQVTISTEQCASDAVVRISDNGFGMDAETRAKAFEPFFTTKPFGKGSGLGLSMVYGFVRQSGGRIEIESEPGKGTVVSLYFPRLSPTEIPAETYSNGVLDRGSERILVVEDDPMVREFAEGTLISLGYSVTCAADATEALRILETNGPFDLVFSDVVMPGAIDGRALATEVIKQYPMLPVVLTTGYADVESIGAESRFRPLVKPYSRRQLAEALREAIDTSGDDQ
ncbi:PAS domain S-box protein [Rhizobium leguminosarum]|nr:PAS domain S-box protein [Rhizobium leguminosarum]TAW36503.1 PAS domain S-box protein [Rhizobium leguminosarum]TAX56938.1 PAS domain S-box protein [Rhizobium leguminosarum]TAY02878.1 PAS domain S-box protein [Rhizobium leguminosarum]